MSDDSTLRQAALLALPGERRKVVPDCLWPSDNDAGIPVLDPDLAADALDLPCNVWGARMGRTELTRQSGTILFYTDDYRFEGLWKNPANLVVGRVTTLGEVNFSVYAQMPPAVALYQIYRKRWLSRYWQECGLRIFVDLNVAPQFYAINLLGIPAGWRAYCTRGYGDRLLYTEGELRQAEAHAQGGRVGEESHVGRKPLFVVYGGGRAVNTWCKENAHRGVVWLPEDIDVRHERALAPVGLNQLALEENHGQG